MKTEETYVDEHPKTGLNRAVITRNTTMLSRFITQWQVTDSNGIVKKPIHLYALLQIFFNDASLHTRQQAHHSINDPASSNTGDEYFLLVTNKTTQHLVLLTLHTTYHGDKTHFNIQYSPKALAYYLGFTKPLLHFLFTKRQIDTRIAKYIVHQLSFPTYFLRMQKRTNTAPTHPLDIPVAAT